MRRRCRNLEGDNLEPFVPTAAGDLEVLTIAPWTRRFPHLTAGMTMRSGGVSEAPFHSLNCGLHVQDAPEAVIENRRRLARALHFAFDAWTAAEQVHGSRVETIRPPDRGKGRDALDTAVPETDGMVTDERDVLLTALFADCVPLFLYDPDHEAVGLVHAGWRGTAAEIAREAVHRMSEAYGSDPSRMLAAIGPSIGACCYEVDEAVALRFRDVPGWERAALPSEEKGKYRLDLKELNRQIMIKAGILPIHIEMSNWCTGCRTDMFFSHRGERGRTGRMAAWIGLRRR